jgi:hypothetical protein
VREIEGSPGQRTGTYPRTRAEAAARAQSRARGFAGSSQQVRRWRRQRRTAPAKTTPRQWRVALPETAVVPPPAPTLPSARQLAWLLVQEPEALDEAQAASLARIVQDEEVARVLGLSRRLAALIRGCGTGRDQPPAEPLRTFDAWLEEARSCGIAAVETFAAGLQQDETAVSAALKQRSNGGSHHQAQTHQAPDVRTR